MKTIISSAILLLFGVSLMAQPATLKLNLEKGKVYKTKSTNVQNMQQSVNGQTFAVEVVINTVVSFKAVSQDKDVMTIEVKFDSIENKTTSPGGKKEVSYSKPAKSNEYFGKIRNRYCKFKPVVKISTAGKFLGFVNYQTFKDSVLAVMDSVPATKKDQVQKQADGLLKQANVQSMIEPLFAYLPEKPVNTGEKWETSYTLASEMASMLLFNTYTLNSTGDNMAKISCTAEMESIPSNDPVKEGAPKMVLDAKGTSTSDLSAELSTGLMSSSVAKSHLEGTMTVTNQGNETKISIVADGQSTTRKIE